MSGCEDIKGTEGQDHVYSKHIISLANEGEFPLKKKRRKKLTKSHTRTHERTHTRFQGFTELFAPGG